MTWYDDFGAGTFETKTTNVAAGVNIFYDKKFLNVVKSVLKLPFFGQRRPLPEGNGKTIEFFRWLNVAVSVTSALLTEGVNPNATIVKGQKLQAVLKEYGAFSQVSSLLKQSHIDTNVAGMSELWGEHAANVLDTLTHQIVCSNAAMPLRADYAADTEATFSGVVDSAAATTLVDVALQTNTNYGDANDDLNQSLVTITSGTGYGQQRSATDYVAIGGTITISPAWDVTPVAGDTYEVTTPDGIVSGDKPTYENTKRARTRLKRNKAPRFPGGYYIGLGSPEALEQLMDDTKWINAHSYKDNANGLFEGEVGKLAGVRYIEETNEFRFPIVTRGTAGSAGGPGADGVNYSATGAVGSMLILGKEAFGVSTFKNKMGNLVKPSIIVKVSNEHDTSNPLNRYGTVGWEKEYVCAPLNPLFAQQIWYYAA